MQFAKQCKSDNAPAKVFSIFFRAILATKGTTAFMIQILRKIHANGAPKDVIDPECVTGGDARWALDKASCRISDEFQFDRFREKMEMRRDVGPVVNVQDLFGFPSFAGPTGADCATVIDLRK